MTFRHLMALLLIGAASGSSAAEAPRRGEVVAALREAAEFFHGSVARHGGYVYLQSADLTLREAEGTTGESTVWVQPPGTPAVGEALLDAYAATGDEVHLTAARGAGRALVLGQLQSGGWTYSIEFDPDKRKAFAYRLGLDGKPSPELVSAKDRGLNGGWEVWKRRKYGSNVTTFDDEVTQAATRFLVRLDRTLGSKDAAVHDAAEFALSSVLTVQYPNGGWSANYDRRQDLPPSEADYPIKAASISETWPRTWPKDFTGCYVTNDDLAADMIDTLLQAHDAYGDERYLAAAKRTGDFVLLAQLPEPQPAWAQQYDREMRPCWSRAFEPPAVSGRESQFILAARMRLHEATGEAKYLEPVPRAIAYLKRSRLADGRLARFYELGTDRPIYFTREGGKHVMTYEDDRIATGYGYIVDSALDGLEAEYARLKEGRPAATPGADDLAADVRRVLDSQDDRGAWVQPGRLKHHKVEPPGGVIDSAAFAANVRTLCRYLEAIAE